MSERMLDPARPFSVHGGRFKREVIATALLRLSDDRSFEVGDMAEAMGLPRHWTYPATTLLGRLKRDGAAVSIRRGCYALTSRIDRQSLTKGENA